MPRLSLSAFGLLLVLVCFGMSMAAPAPIFKVRIDPLNDPLADVRLREAFIHHGDEARVYGMPIKIVFYMQWPDQEPTEYAAGVTRIKLGPDGTLLLEDGYVCWAPYDRLKNNGGNVRCDVQTARLVPVKKIVGLSGVLRMNVRQLQMHATFGR